MDMLHDESMREVVLDFVKESKALLVEMEDVLEDFEEEPDKTEYLEKFGQLIDRIMGAAQTLGAEEIGTICQLGKLIGYKASQNNDKKLNLIVSGIMLDSVDLLNDIFGELESGTFEKKYNIAAFISRLNWLSEKFKHIERSSVSISAGEEKQAPNKSAKTTSELDALIAKLG